MKSIHLLLIGLLLCPMLLLAQDRFQTENGVISMTLETKFGEITGSSQQLSSQADLNSGDIRFEVVMETFQFPNSLIENRIETQYMECHLYPTASFVGKIPNTSDLSFQLAQSIETAVSGQLSLHGESQQVQIPGTLTPQADGTVRLTAAFPIQMADYQIEVPAFAWLPVVRTAKLEVEIHYEAHP